MPIQMRHAMIDHSGRIRDFWSKGYFVKVHGQNDDQQNQGE